MDTIVVIAGTTLALLGIVIMISEWLPVNDDSAPPTRGSLGGG